MLEYERVMLCYVRVVCSLPKHVPLWHSVVYHWPSEGSVHIGGGGGGGCARMLPVVSAGEVPTCVPNAGPIPL